MRLQLTAAALAGVAALTMAGGAGHRMGQAAGSCEPPANMNGKYVKASSLAPHERAYKNQYGTPVSPPILTKHTHHKPKAQPQLHTSPLPTS